MPDTEKLPAGDIEKICLEVLQATPGLENTSEIRIERLNDSSQFTWHMMSITPVPDPIAYDAALHVLRPLQGKYELQEHEHL